MKKISIFYLLLMFFISFTSNSSAQGVIYDADYSVEGEGFPDHTTSSPPAGAPATATGTNWTLSYSATPDTDGSANEFSVNGGALTAQDWGGTATFQSPSIDVSGVETLDINALGVTQGSGVQNGASEFFEYFYILDGITTTFDIPLSGDGAGTAVNYSISGLDVSAASTLVVGFSFNVNGAGDGYVISSFDVESITLLPVELVSFTAKAQREREITLEWLTASEENNSHFEVEHSTNGRDFQMLDKVIGNGTTAEIQEYNFTHTEAATGKNYYRLRQVDFDGAFEYSDVAVIEIKGEGIQIRPTLANENVTLSFGETTRGEVQVQIIDLAGRKVMATSIAAGTDQLDLSVANLEKGLYFVQLALNGELTTLKFVKQ